MFPMACNKWVLPSPVSPYGASKLASRSRGATGTAWPVPNGLVVTNYHVVRDAQDITLVTARGKKFSANLYEKFEDGRIHAADPGRADVAGAQKALDALPTRQPKLFFYEYGWLDSKQ